MNPTPGQNVLTHTLARMLPLKRWQSQVYHLAQRYPPGLMDGYAPIWEAIPFSLSARTTQQARVNFQREFHLLAIAGSSSQAGGFRFQLYDEKKKRRLMDRGIAFSNLLGTGAKGSGLGGGYLYLREPYPFTERNAQALVICQNQDTGGSNNDIQICLYGVARRFNFPN